MNYTPEQARKDYPPNLKRWEVIEIGIKCGLRERAVRALIEGPDASLKSRRLAGQKYGYFRLEEVITAFIPDSTTVTN